MTKAEFYNEVEYFSDLIGFCETHDCAHIVQNIRESDFFDDWVWDVLENNRSRWFWHDVRDMLQRTEAPSSDYFVTPEGINDFTFGELWAEDLEAYKDEVVDWGDDEGFWDDHEPWEDPWETDDDPVEDKDTGDVCWDVSVDLSVLIGAG